MDAQPRVVLADTVLDHDAMRDLEADSIAVVGANDAITNADILALEQIDATAPAAVELAPRGAVPFDRHALDRGILHVPATHDRECQPGRRLLRNEVVEIQRRGDLECPVINLRAEGRGGDLEPAAS